MAPHVLSREDTGYNASDILKNIKIQNVNRLVIAQLNINSLKGKLDALKEVVQKNIDILVITESKLDTSFPSNQFIIDGFSLPYRKDLNTHGGGVVIYVREDLACKELQNIQNSGEGIFLELNLRKIKWLIFGGYNHNKSNITHFLEEIGTILDSCMSKYDNFIHLGDFNSEVNEEGMSDFCDTFNFKNLIKEPTCFKNLVNPSSIDIILTNKYRSFQNSLTVETGLSDYHKMTVTVLKMVVKKQTPICIKYRDYKHYDSLNFPTELSNRLHEFSPEYICYDTFQNIFMDILNKHAKVKMKYIRANNAPFMTRSLTKAIMNRSRLKNRFIKNPNKENELRYKKQRNYCVNLLKKEKKVYFSSLNIDNISNSKKFWKTIKPYFSEKTIINKKITLV